MNKTCRSNQNGETYLAVQVSGGGEVRALSRMNQLLIQRWGQKELGSHEACRGVDVCLCMHICEHIRVYVCVCMCVCMCAPMCLCVHMHVCTYVHVCLCVHAFVCPLCIHVHAYICMCLCVCVRM